MRKRRLTASRMRSGGWVSRARVGRRSTWNRSVEWDALAQAAFDRIQDAQRRLGEQGARGQTFDTEPIRLWDASAQAAFDRIQDAQRRLGKQGARGQTFDTGPIREWDRSAQAAFDRIQDAQRRLGKQGARGQVFDVEPIREWDRSAQAAFDRIQDAQRRLGEQGARGQTFDVEPIREWDRSAQAAFDRIQDAQRRLGEQSARGQVFDVEPILEWDRSAQAAFDRVLDAQRRLGEQGARGQTFDTEPIREWDNSAQAVFDRLQDSFRRMEEQGIRAGMLAFDTRPIRAWEKTAQEAFDTIQDAHRRLAAQGSRAGIFEPEEVELWDASAQAAFERIQDAYRRLQETIGRGGRLQLEVEVSVDFSDVDSLRSALDQIQGELGDLGDALDDLVGERYGERLAAALGLDQGINFGPLDDLAGAIGRVREAATDLPIAPLSRFSAEISAAADAFGTIDTTTWNETADVIRRFGESNWTFTNRLRDFRIQFAQLNEVALGIDPQLWEDAIAPLRDAAWGAGATAAETYRAEIELLSGAYAEAASSETKLREAIASSVSSGATLGTILEGLAADALALADGSFTASQGIQDLRNAAAGAIMLDTAPIKEAFSELEASFTRQQTQQDALQETIDGVGDSYLSAYADIAAGASVVTDQISLIGDDNRELADLTVTEMIALGQQAADTVIQVGDAARTSAEGSVAAIEGAAATIGPILGAGSDAFANFGTTAETAGGTVATASGAAAMAVAVAVEGMVASLAGVNTAFVGVSISAEESGIDVAKAVDEMSDAVYGAGLGMESSLGGASAAFVSLARSAEQAAATINTALESIVTEVDITITTTYVTAYVTVGTPGSGGGVTQVEQDRRIDDTLRGGPIGLAEGGIVTRPTFALLGEDGPEAVIPLDELGSRGEGGGVTVVLNVSGSLLAQDDILAMVERAAARGAALSTRR